MLWPAAIFVSLILYGLLKRFLPRIRHPLIGIFCTPLVIFLIYSIYEILRALDDIVSLQYSFSAYLGFFAIVSIISLFSVLPVTLLQFLLKKGRLIALIYIVMFVGLFLFFYPKSQRYIIDKTARVGPERVCECLGISDKKNAEYYGGSSYVCFGVVYSCKDSIVDQCPGLPNDVRCFTYEDLD